MELHLRIIGGILITLALIHAIFPKYFNWKKELQTLSLVNKQMMQVHTLFIALMLFLMGILCISSSSDLVDTELGKRVSFGFGIFWGVRLLVQFFCYSPKLWKGKAFETFVHIIFSLFWTYLTWTFFSIYLN